MKKRILVLLSAVLLLVQVALAASGDTTVYITNTGEKYHASGCGSLWNSCIAISLEDAVARGYEPCKRCNPPRLGSSSNDGGSSSQVIQLPAPDNSEEIAALEKENQELQDSLDTANEAVDSMREKRDALLNKANRLEEELEEANGALSTAEEALAELRQSSGKLNRNWMIGMCALMAAGIAVIAVIQHRRANTETALSEREKELADVEGKLGRARTAITVAMGEAERRIQDSEQAVAVMQDYLEREGWKADQENLNLVYITRAGRSYHRPWCKNVRSKAYPIPLETAELWGYSPCAVCNPRKRPDDYQKQVTSELPENSPN